MPRNRSISDEGFRLVISMTCVETESYFFHFYSWQNMHGDDGKIEFISIIKTQSTNA
jgi:hypothetical protein